MHDRLDLEQRLDAELADEGGLADWLRAEIRSGEWERRQRHNSQAILRDMALYAARRRQPPRDPILFVPAAFAGRQREQRSRSRSAASRGDPDPEPEPPLRVIPLAAFRRELRRALGDARRPSSEP
jgi:hypothetical protein